MIYNQTRKGRRILAAILTFTLFLTAFINVPAYDRPVEAANYATFPKNFNETILQTAATYLGYPYPYTGKAPNTKRTSGQALDCSAFVQAALVKTGFSGVPGTTAAWSSQIRKQALALTFNGQAVRTAYFSNVDEFNAAKHNPAYENTALVLTTPTMEAVLAAKNALAPGSVLVRYGTDDTMRHASIIVKTIEPKKVVTADAFKGKSYYGDSEGIWGTYAFFYNTMSYFEQAAKELKPYMDIAKSKAAGTICDVSYMMSSFLRSDMQSVIVGLKEGTLKNEYIRLSNLTGIDSTTLLIDPSHPKSTENVLKYSTGERYHYICLIQQELGTSTTPRKLANGKYYYGVGDSSVWKIESLNQKMGVALTNNGHATDKVGCYVVYFNEVAPSRYVRVNLGEYDVDAQQSRSGGTYALAINEIEAQGLATKDPRADLIESVRMTTPNGISFSPIDVGQADSTLLYVVQTDAEEGWEVNPGFWELGIVSGQRADGLDSAIAGVNYCYYDEASGTWLKTAIPNVSDGSMKGFLYREGNRLFVPEKKIPEPEEYYYSFQAKITNTGNIPERTAAFFRVGTGFDWETKEITGMINDRLVIRQDEQVSIVSGWRSPEDQPEQKFYFYEIGEDGKQTPEGVFVAEIKGALNVLDGTGSEVISFCYVSTVDEEDSLAAPSESTEVVSITANYPSYDMLLFTDLTPGTWQYETAKYVYDRKIIQGTTATTFSPNANMTRGQFMVILWRLEGQQKVEFNDPYTDVTESYFGAKAIQWAKDNGLSAGMKDGSFHPNDPMTREQFVTFMYRYAKFKGYDISTNGITYTECKDADMVNQTFATQVEWAYERGFIAATGEILPRNSITRIQAAAIFQRFLKKYEN